MTVYGDVVMVLNFLVDFLLLLGTNRLSGFPAGTMRCALGGAVGGIYSGACLVPELRFLGSWLWRGVFLLLMAGTAFGWNRASVKRTGVFLILSLALGGMAASLGRGSFPGLVTGAAGIWVLSRIAFGEGIGGRSYVPLTVTWGENSVTALALRDTGNLLTDPITGEQVFLISARLGEKLTGLTEKQLSSPLETLAKRPLAGLRLIPYRAVGCDSGMLLGIRADRVKVGNRTQRAVIAFAPEGLGQGMYEALVTG